MKIPWTPSRDTDIYISPATYSRCKSRRLDGGVELPKGRGPRLASSRLAGFRFLSSEVVDGASRSSAEIRQTRCGHYQRNPLIRVPRSASSPRLCLFKLITREFRRARGLYTFPWAAAVAGLEISVGLTHSFLFLSRSLPLVLIDPRTGSQSLEYRRGTGALRMYRWKKIKLPFFFFEATPSVKFYLFNSGPQFIVTNTCVKDCNEIPRLLKKIL